MAIFWTLWRTMVWCRSSSRDCGFVKWHPACTTCTARTLPIGISNARTYYSRESSMWNWRTLVLLGFVWITRADESSAKRTAAQRPTPHRKSSPAPRTIRNWQTCGRSASFSSSCWTGRCRLTTRIRGSSSRTRYRATGCSDPVSATPCPR